MRFRRMRYLTLFTVAMIFASNASAAIGACVAELAGHEQMAGHVRAAKADQPAGKSAGNSLCPESDKAGTCLTHYAQSYQSDGQTTIWADAPAAALIPAHKLVHPAFRAPPKLVVLAAAPPIVGPSLTILFRNFRN